MPLMLFKKALVKPIANFKPIEQKEFKKSNKEDGADMIHSILEHGQALTAGTLVFIDET